jgi:trk system potassium uptake protein TrkA
MEIVIYEASPLGVQIASLLSQSYHRVTLIDPRHDKLEEAGRELDVALKIGRATDLSLLKELALSGYNILLALGQRDEENLVVCHHAKEAGFLQTIAALRESLVSEESGSILAELFRIDYIVNLGQVLGHGILHRTLHPSLLSPRILGRGNIHAVTLQIPADWRYAGKRLDMKWLETHELHCWLVKRNSRDSNDLKKIMLGEIEFGEPFPVFYEGDLITCIGTEQGILSLYPLLDLQRVRFKTVLLLGASAASVQLAKLLRTMGVKVKIVERNRERAQQLSDELSGVGILCYEGCDPALFTQEQLRMVNVVVAATSDIGVNLSFALLAKEYGIEHIVVMADRPHYQEIIQKQGFIYAGSPGDLIAAYLLPLLKSKSIQGFHSLYPGQVDLVECCVSPSGSIVGVPLDELKGTLPKEFHFAYIEREYQILFPQDDLIILPGDYVGFFINPVYLDEVASYF